MDTPPDTQKRPKILPRFPDFDGAEKQIPGGFSALWILNISLGGVVKITWSR